MTTAIETIEAPSNAVQIFADTPRYKCRFTIRSESSDRLYMVSFDAAPGACWWVCSCPGCIRHGGCKHLDAMGAKGRKYGADRETARRLAMRKA